MLEWLQGCDVTRQEFWDYLLIGARGLGIFFLYYVLSRIVRSLVMKLSKKLEAHRQSATDLIGQALSLLLIGLGLITALSEWGFDVRGLIATLGLTGFALGLALKDAVSNLISGLLVILYAPFSLGDLVRISGKEGYVRSIEIKHTVIEEKDTGVLHILPNSKVLGEVISIVR